MRLFAPFTAAALGTLALAAPLAGQSVTTDNSSPFSANSMTGFLTQFNQVGGLTVDWTFSDGTTGSGTWGLLSGGTWGVVGADFSLTAHGNDQAYFSLWTLSTDKDLASFGLDALTGNAVFDIDNFPTVGTLGSSFGNEFNYCSNVFLGGCFSNTTDHWNSLATYLRPIGIGGNSPVGDLYGILDVSFGAETPFEGQVKFQEDLDKVNGISGDPSFPQEETPEPTTMTLVAMGLVGLGAAGKRRRRR
ncbi:MAG TPA: PEP-CTERM sorting domain-containing protein [Gemmatimonadales bacterium]|jgi:hypothetical protein